MSVKIPTKEYKTKKEWSIEGRRLFGDDIMKWKFKCPSCGRVISIQEYKDAY